MTIARYTPEVFKDTRFYELAKKVDDHIELGLISEAIRYHDNTSYSYVLLRKGVTSSHNFAEILKRDIETDPKVLDAMLDHYNERISWAENIIRLRIKSQNQRNREVTPDVAMRAMRSD